jgi:hypothetical protein
MRDKESQHRIDSGERFGKGDLLEVDLVIHQRLDPNLNTYVNRAYDIVHVRDHIPRKEQRNLFDITDSVTSTGLPMVESASWRRDAGLKELPSKGIGSGTGTAPEPAPEPDTDET